ncbi:Uncharacterised protein [Bordetella ansorpii]|uniref:Uncharacterized protein n=1 Tax=Bordetella ansorpii TaxID=288768 RepID=A0A157RHD4_9BORD|nr:hypothetical protein [Bordetella ansorpii]SAI57412.1 Uncharacterised protein [Bordetella ansorpii]
MNSIDPRGVAAARDPRPEAPPAAARGRKRLARKMASCFVAAAMPALDALAMDEPGQQAPAAPDASVVSAAPAKPAWPESDTVLDLLRADARAAARQRLGHAQDWLSSSSPVPQPASLSAPGMPGRDGQDRVDVLAIYGVGRTLHADVAVNGAVWRYRQGRHWPLGIAGQNGEPRYALVAIDLPCVRLRRQDDVRTACLHAEPAHD